MPAADEEDDAALRVVFHRAEWGWIDFDVLPLSDGRTMQATDLCSPFAALLRWLEAIADGCEMARWAVDGEEHSQEFIFLDTAQYCITSPPRPKLLLLDKCGLDPLFIASIEIDRTMLIRAFYEGFRHYAETEHDPSHWEPLEDDAADDEEERSWEGERLKPMRSLTVEAFLRGDRCKQLHFGLPWSWRRGR